MKPDGQNLAAEVLEILDEEKTPMESAPHPRQKLWIRLSVVPEKYDLLRKKESVI